MVWPVTPLHQPLGLHQRNVQPALLQHQRGGDAHDAAPQHRHVGLDLALQPGELGRVRARVQPHRSAVVGERAHDPPSACSSASSSSRMSDSALRAMVKTWVAGFSDRNAEHPVRVLGHPHHGAGRLRAGLHAHGHHGGARRAALGPQPQQRRPLGLDHLGVIADGEGAGAHGVVKLRAGRGPLGLGVADDLRPDDPVDVLAGVGQDIPDGLRRHRHEALVGGHDRQRYPRASGRNRVSAPRAGQGNRLRRANG